MLLFIVYIIVGFFLLVKGGDFLVDGAVAIAKRARLSNMVIGLTIVGFGTSAPELLVSTQAALIGSSGIAIGNVVGSNIANIAMILGLTAMIFPIPATRTTLHRDAPFMVLATILLVIAGCCGTIDRAIGAAFILLLVGFVSWQVINCRRNAEEETGDETVPMALWKAILLVLVSLGALVLGANILIKGASGIALALGTSERIIGLTIVAVGTSLPELFATLMAAVKHQNDMAIGNIIGSVTFNILCVIGVAAVVCPIQDTDIGFMFDYMVMLGLAVILLLFLATRNMLERWEGFILLMAYVAYIVYTVIMP